MSQTRKQQALFPDLPRDTKFVDENGNIESDWRLYFEQLTATLQTLLKPEGYVIPPLSAADIALLIADASKNNIVYDSTNNLFKGNINGVWKTFTLT